MYYVGPEKSRKLNKDCMAGEFNIPRGTIVQVLFEPNETSVIKAL